jgi:cytoskeleton protein RodZ
MESVGELLRKEREALEKTIDDVVRATRMSEVVVAALEEDRFSAMPAAVYVKGHLRTYARYLGLDEEEIIQKYLRFTQQQEDVEPDEWEAVELELHEQTERSNRLALWIAIALIAVGIIVIAAVWWTGREPVEIPPPEPTPAQQLQEAAAQDTLIEWHKLELTAVARERTWLRVVADGTPTADVTLDAGDQRTWQADERFVLDVGNGGGLELYLDGVFLGTAGAGTRLVEGLVVDEDGMSR